MILELDCKWDEELRGVVKDECLSFTVAKKSDDSVLLKVDTKHPSKLLHLLMLLVNKVQVCDDNNFSGEIIDCGISNKFRDHEKRIFEIIDANQTTSDKIYCFVDQTGQYKLSMFAKELREMRNILKIPCDSSKSMLAHVAKHSTSSSSGSGSNGGTSGSGSGSGSVYLFDMTYAAATDACIRALQMIKTGHFNLGETEVILQSPIVIAFFSSVPKTELVLQCEMDIQILSERATVDDTVTSTAAASTRKKRKL